MDEVRVRSSLGLSAGCAADDLALEGVLGPFVNTLLTEAKVGIGIFDLDGRFVLANERLARRHGVPAAAHIGQRICDVIATSMLREWHDAALARALRGERVINHVTPEMLSGDADLQARERFYSEHWFPLHDTSGAIAAAAVIVHDTTRRESARKALAEAYAHLEALFDNVPVVFTIYDLDLRVVRMNQRAGEWIGIDASSISGRHISEVFPRRWPGVREKYERAMRGETQTYEVDRRALGETVGPEHMSITYAPVRMDGAVTGVFVCAVDISERIAHERELAASYSEVQSLLRAEKDALRFRDDIIHFASHELRSPLTSMIGMTQHWERAIASGEATTLDSDDLALVRGESERMSRTLDVILDLVGIDAGLMPMDEEPVALAPLVRRQMRMLHERYPELRLVEDFAAVPIVETDSDRVVQVVTNLLENAAKYAGPRARVVVRLRVEAEPASTVVEVEDDGPGIAPAEQEAIFERRYRGHAGNGTATGLGLGLYISRVIATRLGGMLTVASAPGAGATFTLRLPLATGRPDQDDAGA